MTRGHAYIPRNTIRLGIQKKQTRNYQSNCPGNICVPIGIVNAAIGIIAVPAGIIVDAAIGIIVVGITVDAAIGIIAVSAGIIVDAAIGIIVVGITVDAAIGIGTVSTIGIIGYGSNNGGTAGNNSCSS